MTSDYHAAKNVLGELTFGEYWNLVSGAAAVRVKCGKLLRGVHHQNNRLCIDFGPERGSIKFRFPIRIAGSYAAAAYNIEVRLSEKVVVARNKAKTKLVDGQEVEIEFYELAPIPGLMGES